MPRLLRFLPALVVMLALTVFAYGGERSEPKADLSEPRGPLAGRRSPLPIPSSAPARPDGVERPRVLSRLPRPRPRARVLPHVAQLFADVSTPQETSLAPGVIAANLGFAALLTTVLVFADKCIVPIEEWLRAVIRRRAGRDLFGARVGAYPLVTAVALVLALMVLTSVLQTFLNTGRGPFGPGGAFVFLALLASALLLSGTSELVRYWLARRHGYPAMIEARPAGVALAATSVALSRVSGLVPGLILGKEGGVKYALSGRAAAGRLALAALLTSATVGLAAWAASYLLGRYAPETLSGSRAQDFALGLYLSAVQGFVFGMLPAGGTHGHAVLRWRRGVWLALVLPGAFLLFHTVLNPAAALDATRSVNAPVYIVIAGLLCAIPAWNTPRRQPSLE